MSTRKAKYLVSAAFGLTLAGPALAQEGSDIIVTARRVEERLQDVPISISVVSQQDIQRRNITTATDLAKYVPSLATDNRFSSDNATFSIRGFYAELSTTPTVGVYFADVIQPRGGSSGQTVSGDGAGPGFLFDLQNVQVLKGPQGTLFGRNTTGGSILLVPQKPTSRWEGYVEGTYGNYDTKRVQAVLNVPASDRMRFRFGVDRMKRDGWQKNVSGRGPDRFSDVDYLALRGSMVLDLTPDLENYTIASYSESNTVGAIDKIAACNSDANNLGVVLNGALGLCGPYLARFQGQGFNAVQNGLDRTPLNKTRQWQVINTTTWKATDNLTIKNIASYAQITNKFRNEIFGDYFTLSAATTGTAAQGPIVGFLGAQAAAYITANNLEGVLFSNQQANAAPGYNSGDQLSFTEEFQVQGVALDNKLNYQAGLYYEFSNPLNKTVGNPASFIACRDRATFQCADILGAITFGAVRGSILRNFTQTFYRNYAAYAQATYALTDQLKFTGGIRYTWDRTRGVGNSFAYTFPQPNTPVLNCTYGVQGDGNNGLAENGVIDPNGGIGCENNSRQKSQAPTFTGDIEYAPTQDVLVYAKYARGYRQGAVQPRQPVQPFDQEKIDAYEAGAKLSFHGDVSGYFNLAGFYNKLSNQQQQLSFSLVGTGILTGLYNIGASRVYGAELDSSFRFFRSLQLDASAAYLNTKVTDAGNAASVLPIDPATGNPAMVQGSVIQKGQPLPLAAKWRVTSTLSYDLPLPEEIGKITVSGTYIYTDKSYVTAADAPGTSRIGIDGAPPEYNPESNLFNANVEWHGIAGLPIDLNAFATNLFGKKYIAAVLGGYGSLGVLTVRQGEPRMYGLRLRYRFGA